MRAATLLSSRRALAKAFVVSPAAAAAAAGPAPASSAAPAASPRCASGRAASTSYQARATQGQGLGRPAAAPGRSAAARHQQQQRHTSSSSDCAAAPAAAPASAASSSSPPAPKPPRDQVLTQDPSNNVTEYIYDKMGANLHMRADHPLGIIKAAIYSYFDDGGAAGACAAAPHGGPQKMPPPPYKKHDGRHPVVTARANFDEVLVPEDHVSRSPNDTYYVSADTVLRCHTSAHQAEILREASSPAFLVTGDVYRRDSIDATHYPVFHQMEGVRVYSAEEWGEQDPTEFCVAELKATLEGLARRLFGEVECRWVDAYFPFTEPSLELEIFFNGKWLEVLGCGVMQQKILEENYGPANGGGGSASSLSSSSSSSSSSPSHRAWAFGLGLERLAMVLFDIPDIRLFWSGDQRFLKQFKQGDLSARFKPYSKFPPCYKDVAFWLSPEFSENNLCELVRGIGGDLVEEVSLVDSFTHPKTARTSHCYRISYRSMERSLTDEEINALQERVRAGVAGELKVELR
jgi:phenylalanyl-tRNA synthetase alpha chain